MNVTSVKSSTLISVGYDEGRGVLRLEFRSRATCDYFGVPAAVPASLLSAPSVGEFFNRVVRGGFHFRRVETVAVPDEHGAAKRTLAGGC